MRSADKILIRALGGERLEVPPIWLMRQAGRYLPEYRQVRGEAGSFLDLCYTPKFAEEVTLQPIRRYGFDASIVFSDILVVPDGLGQKVWFEEGAGPRLAPLANGQDVAALRLDQMVGHLAPVYETIARLTSSLPAETCLIGFAGAPWTVATYMIAGQGSPDQAAARLWAYQREADFERLMALLVEATVQHLSSQIEAGAEAVQLFDSWAGSLPEAAFRRWVLAPTQEIVTQLRAVHPDVPIIGFPRHVGPLYEIFAKEAGVQGVSVDTALPVGWAASHVQAHVCVQGNLDPLALVAGGEALRQGVAEILAGFGGGPFVFNLGHGIVPQTPPEHVGQLIDLIRNGCS